MGDWRQMGSSARRRMRAPSYHGGGAVDPRQGISGENGEQDQAFASMEGARTEKRCEYCGGKH